MRASFTIAEILAACGGTLVRRGAWDAFCGVSTDSRTCQTGELFIPLSGERHDGHDFIPKAVSNGAKFIVSQKNIHIDGVQVIIVPDTTVAAAQLAQARWANPGAKLTNLAVTGTNGKTTVAFLVRSIINNAGFKCGLVGTVVYDTGSGLKESSLTTPDSLEIARLQAQMVESGAKYMITEASSHALSQNRLCCIDFKAAAFTNLTGDHLDYHKTEKQYLAAKTVLFENLSADSTAVLNKQSPASTEIAKKTKAKVMWFAVDEPADLTAQVKSMTTAGTVFELKYNGKSEVVNTPLLGRHNVSNLLTAAGLCLAAATATATPYDPGVNRRQANQAARIGNGVGTGELTARETRRLLEVRPCRPAEAVQATGLR